MNTYYDTGVLLKLYTTERDSPAVRHFVTGRKEPIYINLLHRSECTSAFRLKCFRGECEMIQATRAIKNLEDDIKNGVMRLVGIDWDQAWETCRNLSDTHAAEIGCRILDTIHVACAHSLGLQEFISTDKRQSKLAECVGLRVVNPCRK